jgi:hypothetical protein
MKKIQLLIALLGCIFCATAQSPQKMSYQMVVRNSSNVLIANQVVGVKISLLQGSATGTAVFVETHAPTTNANGLASLTIGDGTNVTGSFAAVNWANGPFFIKIETDPTGGTSYTITGTSQLMSVPYALFAGSTTNLGKTHVVISGDLTDAEAAAKIATEAGPNTQFLWIQNTSKLTSLTISELKNLIEVVVVGNDRLTTISLPNLATISSKISITDNDSLVNISAPSLVNVLGLFEIKNCKSLVSFSLPLLARIGYSFTLTSNPLVVSFNLNSLKTIGGDLTISINNSLSAIDFPLLKKTKAFSVGNNANLTSLSIPVLDTVTYFTTNANNLAAVSAPSLTAILGVGTNKGLSILNNNSVLTALSFPNLNNVEGVLSIANNQGLSNINLPSIAKVAAFNITGNFNLSTLSANFSTADNITVSNNNALTSISFPQYINGSGNITIASNNALTSISMPQFTNGVGNILITSNTLLATISFPQLVSLTGNIGFNGDIALTTISFPQLSTISGYIQISNSSIQNISFPELVTITDYLSIAGNISSLSFPKLQNVPNMNIGGVGSGITISFPQLRNGGFITIANSSANSISLPLLTKVNNSLSISGNGITSISLPLLDTVNTMQIYNSNQLTSISLPALKTVITDFSINSNSQLTTLSIPMLSSLGTTNSTASAINLNGNKFSSVEVNALLNKLATITPSLVNKNINLSQSPSAPPTGQGLIDKAILIGRPNTVSTN